MSLRHGLLGLLAEEPSSGYELARRFEELLGAVWPAKHPQIYLELKRLRDEGWIELEREEGRSKKVYRITDSGRAELHRWLLSEPERTFRFEPLLRSFFFWQLAPAELLGVLTAEAEYYRRLSAGYAALARAKDTAADLDAPGRSVRVTLEAGVRLYEALADWAEWAKESQVGEESPPRN